MRFKIMILMACLSPITPAFAADDTGERVYPADERSACMERDMDTARGGCLTREDGSARAVAPQQLPPAPDTTRQSTPDTAVSGRGELPGTSSER